MTRPDGRPEPPRHATETPPDGGDDTDVGLTERLHSRSSGQTREGTTAYLRRRGDAAGAGGIRVVVPAGPPRLSGGAARVLLRVLLAEHARRSETEEGEQG